VKRKSPPIAVKRIVGIKNTIWGYPIPDTIVERGVEILLGLNSLFGVSHQTLGEDQRMALVIVGTDNLLYRIANHVDVNWTGTPVLCEVDPIGVFHVGTVFTQFEELIHQILLILIAINNRPPRSDYIPVSAKSMSITQLRHESRHRLASCLFQTIVEYKIPLRFGGIIQLSSVQVLHLEKSGK